MSGNTTHSTRLALSTLVNDYLGYCRAKRLSPCTLRWYRSKLDILLKVLKERRIVHLDALTAPVLQDVMTTLDDGTRSSYTIRTYAQVLRGFLSYLEDE